MRTIRRTIIALALVLGTSVRTWAYDFMVDGIAYNILSDTTVEVTSGGDYSTPSIVIPSTVVHVNDGSNNEYEVRQIGYEAFYGCYSLESIDIPNTVTYIGRDAFHGCSLLKSIALPERVKFIGECAFALCSSLTAVVIPDGVTRIGVGVFEDCTSLKSVEMPEGVGSVGNSAFKNCYSLTNVVIPEGVTVIEGSAFYKCSSLLSVVIPDSVKSIGGSAFSWCTSLGSIVIPNCITSVEEYTFLNCEALTSIVIPEGVTRIGNHAFDGCSSLTSVVIPNTVKFFGEYAFMGCSSLTSIFIPKGVTTIRNVSFGGCKSLESVAIPDGVTSIGFHAFGDCTSLESVVIPESVKIIEEQAFMNCTSLKSIDIPEDVTSIGEYAFCNCSSLTSVVIPDGVTKIEAKMFMSCYSLETVVIPEGVKSIGDCAFYVCTSLKSINIPSGVTSLGSQVFRGCSSLTSIVIPEGITAIEYDTFRDCSSLTSVVLPDGITTIGEGAFRECSSITSVTIPESVTIIGDETFYGCISLSSVNIPRSVTRIGKNVFEFCKSLTTIVIPDGVTSIGESAFENCTSLKSIVIPNAVTSIGRGAFFNCNSLTSIVIPVGVPSIGEYAFDYCTSLMYLNVIGDEVADYGLYYPILNLNEALIFVDEGLYDQYVDTPGWEDYSKNIISADMLQLKTVEVTANESRSSVFTALGDESLYTANLKIKGSINGYDIMALRNKTIHLLYLDLSEADIVANDGEYEYYSGSSLKSDNELGKSSFADLKLREVILPKSLVSVGDNTFSNCKYLEKVITQDGLLSIGYAAFGNCIFNEIYLPASLIEIGSYAFYNCQNLSGLLRIPDQITEIKTGTFAYTGIDSLIIGQNVISICGERERGAFYNCTNLRDIKFNRKLQTVGPWAFCGCSDLIAADLPYSVELIDNYAFYNCTALKSIKIPSMTKRIGNEAFGGCKNIINVYTYTVEPTEINQNTFSVYTKATLNVPKTSADLYFYNTQWSQFIKVCEFEEPYDAFYLNGDVELNDETGRMSGEPDAEMYETSGFIIEGDATQELSTIELSHNGTNGASIIGSAGQVGGTAANLTAKSMNVNITVEKNRWYFFCFPFNVDRDSIECSSDYMIYSYDGLQRAATGAGWKKLDEDNAVLQKGLGYIFQASKTGILTVHVNKDYLNFAANNESELLHTYEADDVANASWNFVGNPFISYYDIEDLSKEYDSPIAVWNGRGYDVWKPGDDDYQLKPFEAFFVQKTNSKAVVNFLPENRVSYNQAQELKQLRANRRAKMGSVVNPDRLLVNITIMDCDSVTDRTRIVYSTKASMDYEIGVDAAKFHSDGAPQIYSLAGGTRYAINERPAAEDDIKLGYIAPKAGTYTLAVPRQDAEVEIYDNVAQAVVDFTFGDYMFETLAGTYNDRFVIRKTGGVTAVENGFKLDGLTVVAVDGGLDIEGSMKGKVSIYNEAGMLLAEPRQAGKLELGTGVYVVKIGERSVKICVENNIF